VGKKWRPKRKRKNKKARDVKSQYPAASSINGRGGGPTAGGGVRTTRGEEIRKGKGKNGDGAASKSEENASPKCGRRKNKGGLSKKQKSSRKTWVRKGKAESEEWRRS